MEGKFTVDEACRRIEQDVNALIEEVRTEKEETSS